MGMKLSEIWSRRWRRPPVEKRRKGTFREYVEAIAWALVAALLIRHFVVEAFKIPSGSMIPTLEIGDHIFVNKFTYGIRLPFTRIWAAHFSDLKRGEVVVFIYPLDPDKNFIKRVVGLPGDTVLMKAGQLYINGEKMTQQSVTEPEVLEELRDRQSVDYFWETIAGVRHLVRYEREGARSHDFGPKTVPEGYFFAMGDNRDNSSDSRDWGFVPLENLKGRALFVWLSIYRSGRWGPRIRWDRFGTIIR